MSVAVLVDGTFFLKRFRSLFGTDYYSDPREGAHYMGNKLYEATKKHADHLETEIYRVFYYDCDPYEEVQTHPITGEEFDFGRTVQAEFKRSLFYDLRRKRKFALRLGRLRTGGWTINPEKSIQLGKGEISGEDITDRDFRLDFRQKGVDMKIGLDIATLSLKKQVKHIVLISGDSDFIPATKLARMEGIDVILDPMWMRVSEEMLEHIDGLRSTVPPPASRYGEYDGDFASNSSEEDED